MVPMRFVCTWKMNPDGTWVPKARLVAIGFRDGQKHLLDLEADTPARESTRVMLHTFVQLQWRANKWDSRRAFLGSGKQRPWTRKVCLKPPPEATVPPGYVWLALRAVYGLGDGPVEWNAEWEQILLDASFVKVQKDPAVFVLPPRGFKVKIDGATSDGVLIGGYVPDGLVQGHMDDFLWGGTPRVYDVMFSLRIPLRIGLEEKDFPDPLRGSSATGLFFL